MNDLIAELDELLSTCDCGSDCGPERTAAEQAFVDAEAERLFAAIDAARRA